MTSSVEKELTGLDALLSNLLLTLDEESFFSEISRFLVNEVSIKDVSIYQVTTEDIASLIAKNGKIKKSTTEILKGEGCVGHVLKTKRAYFSNNIERDPIFAGIESKDIKSELCIPITCEGMILGVIQLQEKNEEHEFSRDHITKIQEILNVLQAPLRNMKMYLSAKMLNESLLRKLKDQEKEIENKVSSPTLLDQYKVHEKEVIGRSDLITDLLQLCDRVAISKLPVLICGETGTGKEMFAKRVHCRSKRATRSFVSIDCLSMDEVSLDRTLFGEEINGKILTRGALEDAHRGTLYINNVDGMSPRVQERISRFFSDKVGVRVNGSKAYQVDTRVIVSTTKDLSKLVTEGLFKEGLYFELNAVSLNVPALRERKDDIELLASYFINNDRSVDQQKFLSPGAASTLVDYLWPGNIREMQSVLERAYILAEGQIIEKSHLSESVVGANDQKVEIEKKEVVDYQEMTLNELEKMHICKTLEILSGNKTKTAKMLGITVKTLYNKLHSYGMIIAKEA